MKKTIITAVLLVAISTAFAQSKKPVIKPIAAPIDTLYHLGGADVAARFTSTNNLLFLLKQGAGDVTPNQIRKAVAMADSLQKVDVTWLNKVNQPKKIKK